MIEPSTRMAFSMVENPGVYALLLGSGLSRAADVPTGWDITLDLARRVAASEGVEGRRDWRAWHVERFQAEPSYSTLLDALSTTPTERRSILHHYIEPTAQDLEEGRRVPTGAHHAIAGLVKAGFVRVIVTTNFDRLLEQALSAVGVEPVVVRSVDDLRGSSPLPHTRCFLLKVHGDYLDSRILNTEQELASYPAEYDYLLDRIFDEYGLIVSGWSADWDPALRAAIARAPNRRYPTWWASRGEPSKTAHDLVMGRGGAFVAIQDADAFFGGLADAVAALDRARRPDPDSIELLLATTKRNLATQDRRIDLADGVTAEVDRILELITGSDLHTRFATRSDSEKVDSWRRLEGAAEPLARMLGLVGRWGDGSDLRMAQDALQSIAAASPLNGLAFLDPIATYPAYLATLTYGLGLTKAERWEDLLSWFGTEIAVGGQKPRTLIHQFFMQVWRGIRPETWDLWPEMQNRKVPWADHLADAVVPWTRDLAMTSATTLANYHLFELLGALAALGEHETEGLRSAERLVHFPYGQTMCLRADQPDLYERVGLTRAKDGLLAAGFCRSSPAHWDASIHAMDMLANEVGW